MARVFGAGVTAWQLEQTPILAAGAYQVVAADSGSLMLTSGGATTTFTLPTLANGAGCAFCFLNVQNNNMVITAPANKLIIDGNLTATTATFSTASHLIGAMCCVYMNAAGTFYVYQHLCGPGNVVSIS